MRARFLVLPALFAIGVPITLLGYLARAGIEEQDPYWWGPMAMYLAATTAAAYGVVSALRWGTRSEAATWLTRLLLGGGGGLGPPGDAPPVGRQAGRRGSMPSRTHR